GGCVDKRPGISRRAVVVLVTAMILYPRLRVWSQKAQRVGRAPGGGRGGAGIVVPLVLSRMMQYEAGHGPDPAHAGSSWLRLHGLEIREDAPEHVVAQHVLPHGHALVGTPAAHGLLINLGRLGPIAELEPAQVSRP